jgi:hypothetical protein
MRDSRTESRRQRKTRTEAPSRERDVHAAGKIEAGAAFAAPGPGRPPLYAIRDAKPGATLRGTGIVYLVGAGPGNPDLLTLRAALREIEDGVADEAVVDDDLGFADQLRGAQRQQVGIAGARAYQIDDARAA